MGSILRSLRKKSGKTQGQVASETGMTQGMISALEMDKGDPLLSTVQRLAGYYKVEVTELLRGSAAVESKNYDALRLELIRLILMTSNASLGGALKALQELGDRVS